MHAVTSHHAVTEPIPGWLSVVGEVTVEVRVEAIRNRTDWTINNGMAFVSREGHVHCKLSSEGAHSVDESSYDAHEVAHLGGS